jgi:hypothetical protein
VTNIIGCRCFLWVQARDNIVFKYVFNQILRHKYIHKLQSGFLPGYSTSHQLVEIYHSIMTAFENQTPLSLTFCDVMYILMSKDMVKNIFKDSPLKNCTNITKKRCWSIVRSDWFVRFLRNCWGPGILTEINVTEQDIDDIISCLDPQKASGPDDISHRMLIAAKNTMVF